MKVDRKRCKELMEQQNVTVKDMSYKTGLTERSVKWILDNGYASEDAAERMASVLDVSLGEIYKAESKTYTENCIEFVKDGSSATVTFSQGRYKTRIKELAEKHPARCEIVAENEDGSMLAHIPVAWIRINPEMELSEEERERRAECAKKNFTPQINIVKNSNFNENHFSEEIIA